MRRISEVELDDKGRVTSIAEVHTSGGARIVLLPVATFPGHLNNVILVDHPEHRLLFDVGTPTSHPALVAGLAEVGVALGDLDEVVLSHGHMDHYADAWAFRRAGVPIAIHELDARILECFAERRAETERRLGSWLGRAGLSPERVASLVHTYSAAKPAFPDLRPDRRLRDGERVGPGWRVLHVPGHCPGMICLAVDEVVLTADHLLSHTTPVQMPQAITAHTGLEHYLRSLDRLEASGPFALALGAHDGPIPDPAGRIAETRAHHDARLAATHALCAESPRSVAEVSHALFGTQRGYGVLLSLLEAGAHLEYLHQHAFLTVEADRYRARRAWESPWWSARR